MAEKKKAEPKPVCDPNKFKFYPDIFPLEEGVRIKCNTVTCAGTPQWHLGFELHSIDVSSETATKQKRILCCTNCGVLITK